MPKVVIYSEPRIFTLFNLYVYKLSYLYRKPFSTSQPLKTGPFSVYLNTGEVLNQYYKI